MTRIAPVTAAGSSSPAPAWWKKYLPLVIGAVLGATCPYWPAPFKPVCVVVATAIRGIELGGGEPAPALPVGEHPGEPIPYPPAPAGRAP